MRAINEAGLALIRSFESLRLAVYLDETGKWTIGYGHTQGVTAATSAITEAQAETYLLEDINAAGEEIVRLIHVQLSDNQYAALVSLTYNAGPAPLEKTLGEKLNAGDFAGAASEFAKWIYAGGLPSYGLIRRRAAERALFLSN